MIGSHNGRWRRSQRHIQAGIAAATIAWKKLESRGFTLGSEPVTGLAAASGKLRPVLAGKVDGIECSMRIISDFVHYSHTSVIAIPPHGADVTVGVHPNPAGLLGKVRAWLGQDIEVGDPTFDDAFLVTGKLDAAAVALLTPARRDWLIALAASSLAGFTYEPGAVMVLLVGVVTSTEVLATAIELACDAARGQVLPSLPTSGVR